MRLFFRACAAVPFAVAAQAGQSDEAVWTSAAKAMAFLADALPKATGENPKYLTKADGTVSQWITELLQFSADANKSVRVSMIERFTQTLAGVTTPGKHEASFDLEAVEISDFEELGDITPSGGSARGLLFACKRPGCIAARWNSDVSRADKTDVYIQDEAARAMILSAFRYLTAQGE